MFNDRYGLTKAVLEGRKTMTRRIVKHPEEVLMNWHGYLQTEKFRYQVGEVVAVAQAYKDGPLYPCDPYMDTPGWINKMFVRADLMPHQICITGVRVERLQDISDQECVREGITTMTEGRYRVGNGYGWDTTINALERDTFFTPREAFAALIDKVSGKGTWASNPWVFVYVFELIK